MQVKLLQNVPRSPAHGITRKRHRSQTITRQRELLKVKQLALYFSKINAKLERAPITQLQNQDQHRTSTKKGQQQKTTQTTTTAATTTTAKQKQQQQNHHLRKEQQQKPQRWGFGINYYGTVKAQLLLL